MTSSTQNRNAPTRRRSPNLAILVGLAVFAVAALVALLQPTKYSASTNLVVVPKATDAQQAANLFDSLSRGQIVATAAEIYSEKRWIPANTGVELSAGGVTPSAVLTVTATGTDSAVVTNTLGQALTAATPTVNQAIAPYQVINLSAGKAAEAKATGAGKGTLVVLAGVAGLIAGLLTAAVLRMLNRSNQLAD